MKKNGRFPFKKKAGGGPGSIDVSLNITPMADIFTILLVFLIKTYTSSSITLNPSEGTKLPVANAAEANLEALKVEISSKGITVENKQILELDEYKLKGKDPEGAVKDLNDEFALARARQAAIAQGNTDVKADSKIVVLSDEKTPYSLVKLVLGSAAINGYTDFKLAVVREGQ